MFSLAWTRKHEAQRGSCGAAFALIRSNEVRDGGDLVGIKANEVVEFLFGFNSMAKSYFGFSFVLRPVLKARSVSAGTLPDCTLLHFFF